MLSPQNPTPQQTPPSDESSLIDIYQQHMFWGTGGGARSFGADTFISIQKSCYMQNARDGFACVKVWWATKLWAHRGHSLRAQRRRQGCLYTLNTFDICFE
eukprot:5421545-Amphidinium_carterae.1